MREKVKRHFFDENPSEKKNRKKEVSENLLFSFFFLLTSHDVEQAVGPVPQDRDRRRQPRRRGHQLVAERRRVQDAARRVEHEGKGGEEGDEGHDAGVEEVFGREDVGQLGVEDSEADGHGEVDPGLEEGDDLGAGARGGDDEDVLEFFF